jgi:hypothetical protein
MRIKAMVVFSLTGYELGPALLREHHGERLKLHSSFLRDQLIKRSYDL